MYVIQDRVTDTTRTNNARLWAVCDKLGCKLAVKAFGCEDRLGLAGNTYAHKDAIKAAGFRFDGQDKIWLAPSESSFYALEG